MDETTPGEALSANPTSELMTPGPVDARHAVGVQVGPNNVMYVYPPPAEVRWPVQVGLVPLLADCFQERPEMELLREAVRPGGTAVVTQVLAGLGGVGKSQLAAAFAHERSVDVDVLVWVDARSRQAVVAGFARAAARLGLQARDADEAAQMLLVWLRSTQDRSWLVVLDDLADPADLQGLWPTGRRGNTVVTTRRTDAALFSHRRQRVAVGLFSTEQATRYVRDKLAVDEDSPVLDGVELLVEDLQFLPLALAQAAAFMVDRSETCAGYRRRFADRQRTLAELFPADALADDYQATVATTWAISIDAADALVPAGLSRPLLESASLLNPNGFAAELLETVDVGSYLAAHARHSGTGRQDLTDSDCRDALTNLGRLSLVSVNQTADGAFVSVHALVQRATLQHLDTSRRHELAWRTAWSVLRCWPSVEQDRHRAQTFRDSAAALASRTSDDLWIPQQHPLLRHAGRSFRESGSVHAALDFWHQLYRTSDRILGADHPDTLANRHEYAGAIRDTGNVTTAIAELEQLLPDEIRVLGVDHPEVITTRHSIASCNGEAGHFAEALAGLEAILPDRVHIFGADNRHTLATRGNIARFRGECGNPAAAAAEYNKVIQDRTRVFGPDDLDTLEGRSGLAYWKGKAGSPRRAAKEFAALATDYARVLHPDAHQTLTARHDAAKWLGEANATAEAAAALEELVSDMARVLGAEHPDTTATRGSHADWVGEAGDPRRAVALFQDVVRDMELYPGPTSLDTFACRGNLAHWQWESGDRDNAVHALQKLVVDMSKILGNNHSRVAAVRQKLDRYTLLS